MKRLWIVFVLLCASPAVAQQQADPVFLQRAVTALQTQRNQALDNAASIAARAEGLAEELARANVRIKELEQSAEPKKN